MEESSDNGTRRLTEFVEALHDQLASQPNLGDFLLWWGGSLEYWIHINVTTVANRAGRAARSEIPYRTRSRPKGAKPAPDGLWTKWADGAVGLSGGLGLVLEVKCAPCRIEIGTPLYDVGRYDLPALAGLDVDETWRYWHPGERVTDEDWVSYTDPSWRDIRSGITEVWGLAFLLVHGPSLHDDLDDAVSTKIEEGLRNAARYGSTLPPDAITRLRHLHSIERLDLEADGAVGAIFAWIVPLGAVNSAPRVMGPVDTGGVYKRRLGIDHGS